MNPTFTGQNGQRIKTISHAKLNFHLRQDGPMLVQWKSVFPTGKYGPNAIFIVDGDETGEYSYKPLKDGEDHDITGLMSYLNELKGQWVMIEQLGWDNGVPTMTCENADGAEAQGFSQTTPPRAANPQPAQSHQPQQRSAPTGTGGTHSAVDTAVARTVKAVAEMRGLGLAVPDESIGSIYSTHFIQASR